MKTQVCILSNNKLIIALLLILMSGAYADDSSLVNDTAIQAFFSGFSNLSCKDFLGQIDSIQSSIAGIIEQSNKLGAIVTGNNDNNTVDATQVAQIIASISSYCNNNPDDTLIDIIPKLLS